MTHNENAAPFPVSHFKSIIFMSNDCNIVQDFGMFTNVKAASGPLLDGRHRSPIFEETWRKMEWERSVALRCSFPHSPRQNCPAVRCIIGQVETLNRSPQRSSDRFWIASATAVRRRAMTQRGSSLPITALPDTIMLAPAWRREKIRRFFISKEQIELLAWRVSESLTSAHLWMVSGPTPPSTSMSKDGNWLLNQLTWVTPETRRTLSTKFLNAQREGSRERESVYVRNH